MQQLYTTTTNTGLQDLSVHNPTVTVELVEDYLKLKAAQLVRESTFMGWLEAKYA
jgi:hypothetical protein